MLPALALTLLLPTQVDSGRTQVDSERTQVDSGRTQVDSGRTQVDFRGRVETGYPAAREVRGPDRVMGVDAAVIAYSPDGRTVVTGGRDGVARIWQARTGEDLTGEMLLAMDGRKGAIEALGWKGTGVLVTVARNRAVQSWDVATGKVLQSGALKAKVKNVILRPGKDCWLAGQVLGQVGLWNFETGEAGRTFLPKDPRVRALGFASDGKRLVAGTDKGVVRVWDAESGELVRTYEAGTGVRAVAASATHVAAALSNGVVRLWALEGAADLALDGHKGPVNALAFGAKGDQLASGGADKVVRVWDVPSGKLLCLQESHTGEVRAVAFNSNGQKMASAAADRSLRYWTVPLPPLPPGDLEKITAALPARPVVVPRKARKLLVFWRADAILHKGGVPAANTAIELLGKKTGAFEAHFTRDFEALDPAVLARYDALVLNSTAHLVIPEPAKKALLDYVTGGGGIVGIHAAIDTFKKWPEGAAIIGATFGGHPWGPSGSWQVRLEEPGHPLLRAWGGKDFKMHDEFYELAAPYDRSDRRVLMSLDVRDPATAGVTPLHRSDKDFAVSWIKRHGRGRVFYCMFGHIGEPFQSRAVLAYYLDGIQYALGDLEVDASPRPATKDR
jgi:type 1 glutamine amidotransferase